MTEHSRQPPTFTEQALNAVQQSVDTAAPAGWAYITKAQVYATLAVADVLERSLLARSSESSNALQEITGILTEEPKRGVVHTLAAIEEVLGL